MGGRMDGGMNGGPVVVSGGRALSWNKTAS